MEHSFGFMEWLVFIGLCAVIYKMPELHIGDRKKSNIHCGSAMHRFREVKKHIKEHNK